MKDTTPVSGWRTSEFWLNLLAIIVAYYAAHGFGDEETSWATRIVGILAVILPALGYNAGRVIVKREVIRKPPS